jgi:hypothetical protein
LKSSLWLICGIITVHVYSRFSAVAIQTEPAHNNWLWSQVLDSWLEEDVFYIHLYDRNGVLRLPADEELAIVRQISEDKIKRLVQERDAANKLSETERQGRSQAEEMMRQMQEKYDKTILELEKIIEQLRKEKGEPA